MDTAMSETASWQDVGYRCPRPGFFLGDNGCGVHNSSVLLDDDVLPASRDLGQLGKLPVELLHEIVADLAEDDIRSLVALRNVNHGTASIVESWRDFATVAAFPRALAAIVLLTPPNTSSVSLSALATCLRSIDCASCKRRQLREQRQQQQQQQSEGHEVEITETSVPYGDYIYLLTPERICYSCFRSQPEYLPVADFATGTSDPGPGPAAELRDRLLTKVCVPAGRYGVLSRITQPAILYDRRQVYGDESSVPQQQQRQQQQAQQQQQQPASPLLHDPKRGFVRIKPTRPDPVRYAAVIPGPYWEPAEGRRKGRETNMDRGYACRACAQVDRANGHAGWADPLARYTRDGLRKHIEDPRFGGRVLRCRDPRTGADIYQHDAERLGHFPPPIEFGATVDLARRYEAGTLVPERPVVGARA